MDLKPKISPTFAVRVQRQSKGLKDSSSPASDCILVIGFVNLAHHITSFPSGFTTRHKFCSLIVREFSAN